MEVDLSNLISKGQTLAVAVSGGSDSMALLHYAHFNAKKFGINVVALNVEHGIRGAASVADTEFVKDYCLKNGIPVISYSVDSIKNSQKEKLSLEESARNLRYECFFDAIEKKKCDKVATAHHKSDNVESVLLNLFRGTGLKGLSGISTNYQDKIIRPFLNVEKTDIKKYIKENAIPFITDESNFCDDYTRNFLRLNVIPKIKEVFPEMEKSISRFSAIAKEEDEYLEKIAKSAIKSNKNSIEISLPIEKPILARAAVIALKTLGLEKDWEKAHVDAVCGLQQKANGTKISLPKNVFAIKEYDKIAVYKQEKFNNVNDVPFFIGELAVNGFKIIISKTPISGVDLKRGLFADADKIPATAVIRTKKDGDAFTKFGGGTKKLCDYLTDKKIPLRLRNGLPIIANGKDVLVIFGVGISDKIKADENTKYLLKFTYEEIK